MMQKAENTDSMPHGGCQVYEYTWQSGLKFVHIFAPKPLQDWGRGCYNKISCGQCSVFLHFICKSTGCKKIKFI